MSNIIFPALRSPSWKLTRSPFYKTMAQESSSGKYVTAALRSGKLMKWTLKNGVLQAADSVADLQAIQNLFDSMLGMYDSFLYRDPESQTLTPGYDAYHPVKFLSDSLDFDRLCYQIWELGEVSFRQVGTPILTSTGVPLGPPIAPVTAATLTALTSYTAGSSGVGVPVMNADIGTPYITQVDQSPGGLGSLSGGSITLSSDQLTNISQLSIVAFIAGTLSGTDTSPISTMLVNDVYVDVTYPDATTARIRPTTATAVNRDNGAVTNAANAIDGNGATAATITRTVYNGFVFPSYLLLSGFTV